MALRGNTIFPTHECTEQGSPIPDGKSFCPSHMVKALEPTPPVSRVSFESEGKAKKEPRGLHTLPQGVLTALYKRLSGEGLSESAIVDRLSTECGGALLGNGKAKRSLVDSIDDCEFGKLKRRLDRIDYVGVAPEPREAPAPYPATDPIAPRENSLPTKPPLSQPIYVQGRHLPTPMYQEFPPAHGQTVIPSGLTQSRSSAPVAVAAPTCVTPAATTLPHVGNTCDPLFSDAPSSLLPNIPCGSPIGLNFEAHQPPAMPPLPVTATQPGGLDSSSSALTSLAYHVDRLANPDTATKPGTIEGLKRNDEILAYVARFFDNHTSALCPGVTGKSLALGLKALNEKLRPLYDQYRIPCGFSNRFCIFAAGLSRGGRNGKEDRYLTEADFPTRSTRDFDKYTPPAGCTLEPKTRPSQHVEIWKINATNMSRMFAGLYGAELPQERLEAIEHIRSLHIDFPHKYTLQFIKNAW